LFGESFCYNSRSRADGSALTADLKDERSDDEDEVEEVEEVKTEEKVKEVLGKAE
jgi:hypothetical protein